MIRELSDFSTEALQEELMRRGMLASVAPALVRATEIDGRTHYLNPAAIARISNATPSAAWHGVRAFITLADRQTLEVRETCEQLLKAMRT